ncbi:MAG: TIGR01777 family protein [Ardenticatenaceae bacterium]|nr:TIGR01777 family protein [Ardenticatenaceae bacterium]
MRVMITGGSGTIGTALTRRLLADGHEVLVLSRKPEKYSLPAGAQGVKWDGKTADHWHTYINDNTAIINLAGASIAGEGFIPSRWTAERKRAIRQSRLDVGQAVVAGIEAAAHKPKVLIQASAVGYYGPSGAEVLTESAPPGNDFLADVCVAWEATTAPVEAMGVRRVIIRTGLVLTLEDGPLPIVVLQYKLFAGGKLGNGRQWWPWIHLDDEVKAIAFLLENESAQGVYNLTAPNPLTNNDFGKVVGQVLGRPHFIPAPAFALKLLLGEIATLVLDGQRAIPQRLQEAGFSFKYTEAKAALTDLLK